MTDKESIALMESHCDIVLKSHLAFGMDARELETLRKQVENNITTQLVFLF